jgi:hypothetical protein
VSRLLLKRRRLTHALFKEACKLSFTLAADEDGKIACKNTKVDPVKDSKQVADAFEELEKK